MIGTRFWATQEALVDQRLVRPTLAHDGDDTIRTRIVDTVRRIDWPGRYFGRVLRSAFIERWHGDDAGLRQNLPEQERLWQGAAEAADTSVVAPFVGEAISLVRSAQTAANVVTSIGVDLQKGFRYISGAV